MYHAGETNSPWGEVLEDWCTHSLSSPQSSVCLLSFEVRAAQLRTSVIPLSPILASKPRLLLVPPSRGACNSDLYILLCSVLAKIYHKHRWLNIMMFQSTQPEVISTAWIPEPSTISRRIRTPWCLFNQGQVQLFPMDIPDLQVTNP